MSSDKPAPWSPETGGVAVWLRLTPKGGRDAIEGVETLSDGRAVLKARVRAAPEDGRANAALIELIAKALRAPKNAVSIRSGETSRVKKIFIAGDSATYLDALAKLAPTSG
ncbi:DUF167 family protein [Methylocystis sp. WRRC1]|uniref:DUF167 family protein n=1 Tax=unclassified Methylocystis TaxID=2625913 RepID=UPI0001F877C7|nr:MULTISPECIES: DUF167 family protein [unclassified Methylocystis]MCC3243873.1 DUF167 family protein [Methylocystis sp. WRRC1]